MPSHTFATPPCCCSEAPAPPSCLPARAPAGRASAPLARCALMTTAEGATTFASLRSVLGWLELGWLEASSAACSGRVECSTGLRDLPPAAADAPANGSRPVVLSRPHAAAVPVPRDPEPQAQRLRRSTDPRLGRTFLPLSLQYREPTPAGQRAALRLVRHALHRSCTSCHQCTCACGTGQSSSHSVHPLRPVRAFSGTPLCPAQCLVYQKRATQHVTE